ncbi:MAG TPA: alkaline phosphatase family protein [Streptosporangiaceae bacterium]|nr:alkaline phosphatase family protein [Streptosporangiaceae bacterium]
MPIDHVVVLCLENRSFDHMLGYLDHPADDFDGLLRGGSFDNAGADGGSRVRATPEAKRVLPFGPDHSHDAVMAQLRLTGSGKNRHPTNDGFVVSYERKAGGLVPVKLGGVLGPVLGWWQGRKRATTPTAKGRGPLVMLCQPPAQVPVLSQLALDFAVCDRWFCSVPGETWPNRNFLHAATSDGETNIEIRPYTNPTIFELLEKHGATWRIYHDDTPQVWAFPALWDTAERHQNWYPSARFAEHVAAGDLPNYSFIEPNHRPPLHMLDHNAAFGGSPGVSDSQHPENNLVSDQAYDAFNAAADTDFARGEGLIATIYEALRANPELFSRTMLLITYDEHGGLYDHRLPPAAPAPGGGRGPIGRILHGIWHRQVHRFDFTMLGPRVPAVIVSPLIDAGTVDHREHDHASVPATLRALFAPNVKSLTRRDAWAPPFHDLAKRQLPRTDMPDLSGYVPATPAARAVAATPAAATASTAAGALAADAGTVPPYYRDFIKQSDEVRKRLRRVGEPEMPAAAAPAGIQRAAQTTRAFEQAAHRHRHSS